MLGHPKGFTITRGKYAKELVEVRKFIAAHRSHDGVQMAVEYLDRWLWAAKAGDISVPGQREFSRLADAGVDGVTILAEVAGMYLFAMRNEHLVPWDTRLDYQLAIATSHTARRKSRTVWVPGRGNRPRFDKVPGGERREIGERLRNTLNPLLFNIAYTLGLRWLNSSAAIGAMRQAFSNNDIKEE
jgi:hypothetical protein